MGNFIVIVGFSFVILVFYVIYLFIYFFCSAKLIACMEFLQICPGTLQKFIRIDESWKLKCKCDLQKQFLFYISMHNITTLNLSGLIYFKLVHANF